MSGFGKGSFYGSASFVVSPRLQRVSAGYVDDEIVTVRKMARAGATAEEIGTAIGKSGVVARNIIRRNGIVWNQKTLDRHAVKSAQTIGSYMERGAYDWHERALEMRRSGASQQEVADAVGRNISLVSKLFRKHGLGRISRKYTRKSQRETA